MTRDQIREAFEKWRARHAVTVALDGGTGPNKDEIARAAWSACADFLAPLLQDAQRYQWWCDTSNDIPSSVFYQGKPMIDAFIDGATKGKA